MPILEVTMRLKCINVYETKRAEPGVEVHSVVAVVTVCLVEKACLLQAW